MTPSLLRRALLASSLVIVAACGGGEPTVPVDTAPSRIVAASPATQAGVVATAAASAPSVRVTTASGTPVAGVQVTFAVAAGGGTLSGATQSTNPQGVATVGGWTLGTTAGENRVTATFTGYTGTPVTFTANAAAGPAAAIAFGRDSVLLDQWGDTATVAATVTDEHGNVVPGGVTWSGGDAAIATVESGIVRSTRVGRTTVQASAPGAAGPIVAALPVRVVLQRNAACVAPVPGTRGATLGAPAYGGAEILTTVTTPAWDGSRSLAVDYDGDGDTDVLRMEYSYPSSATYSGTLRVFENDGGVLRDSTSVVLAGSVVPDHPRDFEIADFDRDGVDEVYVAQHGYDAAPYPGAPNLYFDWSGGKLQQVAANRFAGMQSSAFSHGSSTADIDCDGDLDIVELNVSSALANQLWVNDGSGAFTSAPSNAPEITGGAPAQRWQEVAFIDFDADGDPDMYLGARSGPGWNEDLLLVNDGFGRFRRTSAVSVPAPRFATAHGINNAKAADFDGDGRQDLIVYEIPQPFSTSSAIRLWLNQGDGSFRDASTDWGLPNLCGGEVIEPLYVRDYNGDGWPDVSIWNGCPELANSGILFNRGNRFELFDYSTIEPWLGGDVVTPIDIDGDGKLDLFFGERGGDPVVVRQP